jgi:hypothetical protein
MHACWLAIVVAEKQHEVGGNPGLVSSGYTFVGEGTSAMASKLDKT